MKNKSCVIFMLAVVLACRLAAAGAKINFDAEEYDWGVIYQGETVKHEYKLRNDGDQPLSISQVKTSCGCTVAKDWPKLLAPGKSGVIKINFNSGSRQGRNEKSISVHSNDATRPLVKLKIHGNIKKLIDILPSQVVSLGVITLGESATGTFEVFSLEGKMAIEKLEYNREKLDINYEKIKKEDGREGYLFKVELKKGTPIGRIYETIKIETDLARKKMFEVKITGNVAGRIRAYPPRLSFSGIKSGEEKKHEFTLKRTDGKLLEVQKIVVDREDVKAEVVGGPAGSVVLVSVTVKFSGSAPQMRRLSGMIKVYVNDPDQPVVDVIYSAYFARTKPATRLQPQKKR